MSSNEEQCLFGDFILLRFYFLNFRVSRVGIFLLFTFLGTNLVWNPNKLIYFFKSVHTRRDHGWKYINTNRFTVNYHLLFWSWLKSVGSPNKTVKLSDLPSKYHFTHDISLATFTFTIGLHNKILYSLILFKLMT